MPSVFPWTEGSPLLAVILVAGTLAILIALAWSYAWLRRFLAKFESSAPDAPLLRASAFLRRVRVSAAWVLVLIGAYGILRVAALVWEPIATTITDPALARGPAFTLLALTLIVASLVLEALNHLTSALADRARRRGKEPNRQMLRAIRLALRYAVLFVAGILALAAALEILGYQGGVGGAILDGLTAHASAIALLAGLIGVGWLGGRLIQAATTEVRGTTTRFSPEVTAAVGAAARGVLYAVLVLIAIFTILQAAGLGSVGGTLVLVLSSLIGIGVAIAGTGSVGNALSGAVLLALRPFVKGDRVILPGPLECDVEEVTLIFTRVRTLANAVVEVPNNQILSGSVQNLSRSGAHAMVVKLGIGYDVSHALVRDLATRAAAASPGILAEPAPALYTREFGNYAIAYELYAYTKEPRHLAPRSELLGRIQQAFFDAGIEILTPDFFVIRPGKHHEPEGPAQLATAPVESGTKARSGATGTAQEAPR
ncbi:MAG: mechanosensitive ion channel family protein [Thermoplasmatota archaeon]